MAGHGYAVVSAGPDAIDTEFVCIVRPITRATTPDGGPLRYRVSHRAQLWQPGTPPKLSSACSKATQSCRSDRSAGSARAGVIHNLISNMVVTTRA